MRVSRRCELEFARGRAIQEPGGQHALIDDSELLDADALGVKGLRTQATPPQRIVDDANVAGEELLAEAIFQKAGLSRNRCAVDGANQMADQRTRNARIVHYRHLAGLDLARIGAGNGALAGAAADAFGGNEIFGMRRRGEIVVTLHRRTFAGDSRRRYSLAGTQVGAVKAGAGHEHHATYS